MSPLKWLLIFVVFALAGFEDSLEDATFEYSVAHRNGLNERRRRLISVQKTLTKIKHHMKRASELRAALRAELEKRHRAIAEKMRKQIEAQKTEMLGAHKTRMKKLASQMAHFKKQMAHHKQMEAEFREKMEAMKDRLKKIHGIEMTEDGQFKRMKDKFGATDGKDNSIVKKAVAKAKAKARTRLNKARERMMKVLQQAEDPKLGKHRTCLKESLKNMVQVKGHLPHEKDPTDYADPADAGRHKNHMSKARDHLKKALKASRDCHKLHQGPFHQFGEDDEYVDTKGKKSIETQVKAMNPNEVLGYDDDSQDSHNFFEEYLDRRKLMGDMDAPLVLPRKS